MIRKALVIGFIAAFFISGHTVQAAQPSEPDNFEQAVAEWEAAEKAREAAAPATQETRISSKKTTLPVNIYKIQPGDSLFDVCNKFHITLRDLLKQNPALTERPDKTVYPNEQIEVPNQETLTGFEKQVLDLVNAERAKVGLAAVSGGYTELNRSAKIKADDMANNNYFSHQSPTLGSPFDQMRNLGVQYRSAGENIAMGQQTPAAVMDAWMKSPGHKANIMNGSYTHLGVGLTDHNGKKHWVQQFVGK